MCERLIDTQVSYWKSVGGYDAVAARMLPGGELFDRERLNFWNRLALAEENDECVSADIDLARWLED